MAAALVTFASDTGAVIVAEGIETAPERTTLQDLGVPWGQGFHLGRPGRLEDVVLDLRGSGRVRPGDQAV
jgi:EAL domain-containing protein (putative c-di-GMP-specific phosphodiesterase class I)